jgi:hypothetical protein
VGGDGPKPSTEGIVNANMLRENPLPRIDVDALWLWGRLRDFERYEILSKGPVELFELMTESMRDDCARILPGVLAWLERVPAADPRSKTHVSEIKKARNVPDA